MAPEHMDGAETESLERSLVSCTPWHIKAFFLLSTPATVCFPFVQLSMSTLLLNLCAGVFFFFLQLERYTKAHLSGETRGLKELRVMSRKTALIMLTVTVRTDANVSGWVSHVRGAVSILWALPWLTSPVDVSPRLLNDVSSQSGEEWEEGVTRKLSYLTYISFCVLKWRKKNCKFS